MNKFRPLPDRKYLRECFRYSPVTGDLFWKCRPRRHFTTDRGWKVFNKNFAGAKALASITTAGYRAGVLDGETQQANRIVWKLATGEDPPVLLDHKDRNKKNNRQGNLRLAGYSQNFINRTKSWGRHQRIGVKQSRNGNWEARIHKNYKYIHLGTFASKKAAAHARQLAAKELYGEFVP